MSPATLIQTPGALSPLIDEIVALAEQVSERTDGLNVMRWKSVSAPSPLPALWHWMTEPPPPEPRDQNRLRDNITISAYIGMRHSDPEADMADLERYCDAYRAVVDPQLYRPTAGGPLNGTATWAERLGMRLVAVDFSGVELIAFEFPLLFKLDRQLVND